VLTPLLVNSVDRLMDVNYFKSENSVYIYHLVQSSDNVYKLVFYRMNNIHTIDYVTEWSFTDVQSEPKVQVFGHSSNMGNNVLADEVDSQRMLVMIYTESEVKVIAYSDSILTIPFNNSKSVSTFYTVTTSDTTIESATIYSTGMRRFDVSASTCTNTVGSSGLDVKLIVSLHQLNDTESIVLIRDIPEFRNYDQDVDTTKDPLNPALRPDTFDCNNGYLDENNQCTLPEESQIIIPFRVQNLQVRFPSLPFKMSSATKNTVCSNIFKRSSDNYKCLASIPDPTCRYQIAQYFRSNPFFWINSLYIVGENDRILIYGLRQSLQSEILQVSFLNEVKAIGRIIDISISGNGQHIMMAVARRGWEINSVVRLTEICDTLKKKHSLFLSQYEEICRNYPEITSIDLNQFGMYASSCFSSVGCEQLDKWTVQYPLQPGYYTMRPSYLTLCEPGSFCINGLKSPCTSGFVCPRSGMVQPEVSKIIL
jgi:hypothetical protein